MVLTWSFSVQIILAAVALVAVASALPLEEPEKTLRSNFDASPDGQYNFGYVMKQAAFLFASYDYFCFS